MLAVYVEAPNVTDPLSAIVVGERPLPEVPEGHVLVKMSAVALNPHDILTVQGFSGLNGREQIFPMILGSEGVGKLDDGTEVVIYPVINTPGWRGAEVDDPDRRIFGEWDQGTFAEYVAVPAHNAVPVPPGLVRDTAAVAGAAWLTAYRMLFVKGQVRAGQTILVQGASGGVSTALTQLGKAAGMQVWVTGRSEEKLEAARRLGASQTYLTGTKLPGLADAAFETVGAVTFGHSVESVRPGGTVVVCGAVGGIDAHLDLRRLFVEEIDVRGVFAGARQDLVDLMSFLAQTGIKPQIGHVLPLREAGEAFRLLAAGKSNGKIVLTCD